MIKFLTSYVVKKPRSKSNYSSHIWATDEKHAENLCVLRGLNETIRGAQFGTSEESVDTKAFIDHKREDFPHTLCFVGYVALKSGMTADEIFGDVGIIHEVIHAKLTIKDFENCQAFKNYLHLCRMLGFIT